MENVDTEIQMLDKDKELQGASRMHTIWPCECAISDLEACFTGEEGFGKYVDLHEVFYFYSNLKAAPKLDYLGEHKRIAINW